MKINEQTLKNLGKTLANSCLAIEENIVIYLEGGLGVGKTTFARAFIQSYGVKRVKSPTYGLVESYQTSNKLVHHFDCYRLFDPEELELIGIRDYNGKGVVSLVEWADKAMGVIASPHLIIQLDDCENAPEYRQLSTHAKHPIGQALLAHFK